MSLELERAHRKLYKLLDSFLESKHFFWLRGPEQVFGSFATAVFIDHMMFEEKVVPADWNEKNIEHCCTESIPNTAGAPSIFPFVMIRILEAFFLYLEEKKALKNGTALAKHIREIEPKILAGFAKSPMVALSRNILSSPFDDIEGFYDEAPKDYSSRN